MTTIELKKILIHRISEIDDESVLRAIKAIIDSKSQSQSQSQSQILSLTQNEKEEIAESRKEIEKGLFIEQQELDVEFNKWLGAK